MKFELMKNTFVFYLKRLKKTQPLQNVSFFKCLKEILISVSPHFSSTLQLIFMMQCNPQVWK